jgi:hypothetical protein
MASGWLTARANPVSKKCTSCRFPGRGGKWQISTGGGCYPRWRHDEKELFYLSADNKIVAAAVSAGRSSFVIGAVTPLFETPISRAFIGAYDVAGDGQRFIICYEELGRGAEEVKPPRT